MAPAADFNAAQKIYFFKDAIEKLTGIVAKNKGVQEISATSPLVASNPGLFTRLGLKVIGPISPEKRKEDFESETRPISRATMSREEFLSKYKRSILANMKLWIKNLIK